MSRRSPATIGLVCEGESDFVLLGAVARTLWPAATRVRRLHPEVDELTGYAIGASGWTGVRAWCEKNAGRLTDWVIDPGIGDPLDLLLIAVDSDVAERAIGPDAVEAGARSSHVPTRLAAVIRTWLGLDAEDDRDDPPELVISTPTLAIETWVIAALYPSQRAPEQLAEPARFLVGKRRLSMDRTRPNKVKKAPETYRAFAVALGDRLGSVRKRCPEAERTCTAIEGRRRARAR